MGKYKRINEAAKELSKLGASKGGKARAEKLTPEERSEIARNAVEARWEKQQGKDFLKAEYIGELKIGEYKIPCGVLNNGKRILIQREVVGLLTGNKKGGLDRYFRPKNLQKFVPDRFKEESWDRKIIPIKYRGRDAQSFEATDLIDICEMYLEARNAGKLLASQENLAKQAEIIIRSFAKIGIIAVIDEVTGYQEIRDRFALQKILDKYLTNEWAKWTKTFPDDFYRELFRLKGIKYPPSTGGKKPGYVGHWTNDVIYSRLAPGVLKELKKKNPRQESGNRKRKHHQHLTKDYGHPELKELLSNTTFLMKASPDWDTFNDMINKARPKHGDTLLLDFDKKEND